MLYSIKMAIFVRFLLMDFMAITGAHSFIRSISIHPWGLTNVTILVSHYDVPKINTSNDLTTLSRFPDYILGPCPATDDPLASYFSVPPFIRSLREIIAGRRM